MAGRGLSPALPRALPELPQLPRGNRAGRALVNAAAHSVLMLLAITNHSFAWQGEQEPSTRRGGQNGKMGSGDPIPLRRWVVFHIS